MPADTRLGVFSHLYFNDGTYVSPDWVDIDLISDLVLGSEWEKGDSSARRSQVRTMEPTMLGLDLTGKVRTDSSDDGWNKLRDAFFAKETVDFMALNGAETRNGSTGYRFDGKVFSFGEDQGLANVLFNDFNVVPCASENDPVKVLVTAGAPVFSPIAEEPS